MHPFSRRASPFVLGSRFQVVLVVAAGVVAALFVHGLGGSLAPLFGGPAYVGSVPLDAVHPGAAFVLRPSELGVNLPLVAGLAGSAVAALIVAALWSLDLSLVLLLRALRALRVLDRYPQSGSAGQSGPASPPLVGYAGPGDLTARRG